MQLTVDSRKLPTGWAIKTLDELCEIARGGSPRPIQSFLTNDPDGVNWIKISDASASSKYIYETKEKIKPDGLKHSRLVHKGDFILSNSMSFGRPYIMRTSGCIHDGWLVLKDKSGLFDQDYLYYFLGSSSTYRQFDKLAAGSTVRNLNIDLVKRVKVTLPPLPEQKRIVTILDEAFEGIDRAIANTEKNLANSRELFESYLNAIFTHKGDGWEEKKLKEISECVSVGYVGETSSFYCDKDNGVPFIRSQNVRPGGLELNGVRYVTKEFHTKVKKSRLLPGDLLFVRVGANRGDCCSVPDDIGELNCANIVFARPRQGLIEYLEYYCQSKIGRELLIGMTTGSAQGVINTKSVAELPIPFPPIDEQKHISDRINALVVETQRLEAIYRRKIAALNELKQSILQKAFTGELTADTANHTTKAAQEVNAA